MTDIAIYGAGGFGREVKTLIDDLNSINMTYNIVGFFDDEIKKGTIINNIPVLGNINDLNKINKPLKIALGIGIPEIKNKVIKAITNTNISFPVLIHPSAIIGKDDVNIDDGTIICANVVITCNIKIEKFVTLNLMCTVGHDTIIKQYSSFMPSVNISGEVEISKRVYVGTGASIINQIKIGESTIIGAGAVVSKNLPANCTAVGIPAKAIKFHNKN